MRRLAFAFILLISSPAFALDYAIDTFYDFGRRGSSGTVEEEDLTDEFYYQKFDIKFFQKLTAKASYYIKYQYYTKDFDNNENLNNNFHSTRLSLDSILYSKDGFSIKTGPDFEFKEKLYRNSPASNYDQIKIDLPFIFKKDGDWTVKAAGGINSYHYPNTPKDQLKLNARFDVSKKLFDERLEISAFYKLQEIEREKLANRLERTYGAGLDYKIESPVIRELGAGFEQGMDNTIIYEEREDSYDFKYFMWFFKTRHSFFEKLKVNLRYANIVRNYADYDHNFDGFVFENNCVWTALDTKDSTIDLKFDYLHKQFRFPYASSPFSIYNNNVSGAMEFERKEKWKGYLSYETKFYDFPAKRTNDKIYYIIKAGIEKYVIKDSFLVGFDYRYTYKNYLHKPRIFEDVFRIRATYKF